MEKFLTSLVKVAVIVGISFCVFVGCGWFIYGSCGDHVSVRPEYVPNGPKIEFTMANGKKFVITTDPTRSPKTVKHFLALASSHYYDGRSLPRVTDWVVRWGDPPAKKAPAVKIGERALGYDGWFNVRFDAIWEPYVVGAASDSQKLQNQDTQLFVLRGDLMWNQIYEYDPFVGAVTAVVGKVTQGMDVIDGIKKGDKVRTARVLP